MTAEEIADKGLGGGDYAPVSIQVPHIYDVLDRALDAAVIEHGPAAKAVAWDIYQAFRRDIGHG